jgi:toxin FitB
VIVLDTNVLSELMRERPAPAVMRWLGGQSAANLYTTSITQAELLYGVRLLPAGKRRTAFEAQAEAMFREDFAARVLPFGSDAARAFAAIASERKRAGRPMSQSDAQIAAIARATRASLATRNVSDFEKCGIDVVDPWA